MLKIPWAAALLAGALGIGLLAGGASYGGESDHEQARHALEAGEILPLRSVMDQVDRDYPGQIVKIEFERDDGIWIYEIKVLQSGGRLVKLKIDARDGTVLKVKDKNTKHKDGN
ncbi:PepSY domain-containing protein [Alcaligenaceae bacterium]|nr:PepSY domain-containing protein [Alcaligenaceae bacterium]